MKKLNIAELLKSCSTGMELDSTIVNGLYFDEVTGSNMIKCYTKRHDKFTSTCNSIYFYPDGSYLNHTRAKCVIFPKGKTTWEGFQRPFKDGDVLIGKSGEPFIFKRLNNNEGCYSYCGINSVGQFKLESDDWTFANSLRFATEEEKQKLFDAIKANGYKWNPETKTLEKLPKFKVGDRVKKNKDYISGIVTDIFDDSFKVTYKDGSCSYVQFHYQHKWELVPNKFDISTLKPFNKVLVRCNSLEKWHIQFFEKYNTELDAKYPFICLCNSKYCQCIPYEGNEFLLGTTNDCAEYFKTWE